MHRPGAQIQEGGVPDELRGEYDARRAELIERVSEVRTPCSTRPPGLRRPRPRSRARAAARPHSHPPTPLASLPAPHPPPRPHFHLPLSPNTGG